MVEDEVGVRVRALSDGGRLEQLADAAGRVDVVLHRYNEFFSKLKKAKYVHANIPGLRLLFELRLPSQREAEQFVLQVAFVGVWRKVGAANSPTFVLKGVQALARHHPFVSDTLVLGELVVYHTRVVRIWAVSHSTD